MPVSERQVTPNFRQKPVRSKPHLRFVSHCGCVVPGCWLNRPFGLVMGLLVRLRLKKGPEPNPYVAGHHVRRAASAGTGVKPGDDQCVGLCDVHHKAVHQRGEKTCAQEWGIDLMQEAERLAAAGRMLGFLPAE